MKKYGVIKEQLSFGDLKKVVFGYYDAHDRTEKELLSLTELDVLEHLEDYEVDFAELVNELNDYELDETTIDLDDFFYNDKEFNNTYITEVKADNSYNWNSSATFNFNFITINDVEYVAIKFHKYGDVRSNYTDYMLLDLRHHEFLETLLELNSYIELNVKGYNIYLSYNVLSEASCYEVDSPDLDLYLDNEYIDLDTTSVETIKEGLTQYLIDNEYID